MVRLGGDWPQELAIVIYLNVCHFVSIRHLVFVRHFVSFKRTHRSILCDKPLDSKRLRVVLKRTPRDSLRDKPL